MSEIKLFKLNGRSAVEIAGEAVALERSLQALIEANLETFLGVRFLATEQSTGKAHKGRYRSNQRPGSTVARRV